MRSAALGLALLVLAAVAARAGADSDALVKFGLIGDWARDCKAFPSPTNPFMTFLPSTAGQPTRQIITGKPQYDSLVPISDAALVDGNHLRLSYPQGGVTMTVTLLKDQRRIRPFEAVASDGTLSVHGGIVQASGQPTGWIEKCDD
ncbi:MAG TPA: hypothetical protein VGL83_13740 [Stellaceae bacterium]|jgi:hypothetical protein